MDFTKGMGKGGEGLPCKKLNRPIDFANVCSTNVVVNKYLIKKILLFLNLSYNQIGDVDMVSIMAPKGILH